MIIRNAVEDDTINIAHHLMDILGELTHRSPNVDKALQYIYDQVLENKILVVETKTGDIAASINWKLYQPWFSDDNVITNTWLCVGPDYKGSEALPLILASMREISDQTSSDLILNITDYKKKPGTGRGKFSEILRYTPIGWEAIIRRGNNVRRHDDH